MTTAGKQRKARRSERLATAAFSYLSSVETFLLSPDGREVLLLKRGRHKAVLPGFYGGVGGKMDSPSVESPLEAAGREMFEESGYRTADLKTRLRLRSIFTVFDKFGRWNVFEFAATVREKTFQNKKRISEGTLEWVKIRDLKKKRLIQDLRNGLLERIVSAKKIFFVTVAYGRDDKIRSIQTREE